MANSMQEIIQDKEQGATRLERLIEEFMQDIRHADQNLLAQQRSSNLRHCFRKPCRCVSSYVSRGTVYNDVITNMSIEGAFIETRIPPYADRELLLTFSLPDFKLPITIIAKIVWIGHQGFGVQFKFR